MVVSYQKRIFRRKQKGVLLEIYASIKISVAVNGKVVRTLLLHQADAYRLVKAWYPLLLQDLNTAIGLDHLDSLFML
jgi:hypothetical protein